MMTPAHLLLLFALLTQAAPDTAAPVWPPPPARPRVRHVATLADPGDFRAEPSFLDRIAGFLFGGESSERWLVQPVGIAVSPAGLLAVADPGAGGVHLLDTGRRRHTFIARTADAPFRSPVGAAFSADGMLFVTDSEAGVVAVFDEDGDPESVLPVSLGRPTGIAVIRDSLYVAETGGHQIAVLSRDGRLLRRWGARGTGPGEFNFPVALTARDDLFVVDALNYRVQRLTPGGVSLGSVGALGNARGSFAGPKSAALDSEGHLYVTDALMDNIQVFDTAGALLLVVGSPGTGPGRFQSPSGIAVDRGDRIYVVDALNRRIQVFQYLP